MPPSPRWWRGPNDATAPDEVARAHHKAGWDDQEQVSADAQNQAAWDAFLLERLATAPRTQGATQTPVTSVPEQPTNPAAPFTERRTA